MTNNGSTDLMSYFYRQVVSKSPAKSMAAPDYENGWNAINQLIRQDYSWAAPEPNVFFVRRAGRYHDFSGVSGIDKAEDSRAFAFTDIDGDGNLDIVLKSRMGPQVRVFRNACGTARKTIVLALRGTKSNRDAIGARVEVDGQVKWLVAGSAYLSQHTKRLHFGLADRERAEKIRIHWPSGTVQDLPPLAAGFLYEVTEGSPDIRSRRLAPRTELPEGAPFPTDNRARPHDSWLWEPVPLPERRRGPMLLVLHAGEPLPRLPVAVESLDLREAAGDLAAAYAIFRRYLFDYRVDLETPQWFLVDAESRVRKIYATAPDAATAAGRPAVTGWAAARSARPAVRRLLHRASHAAITTRSAARCCRPATPSRPCPTWRRCCGARRTTSRRCSRSAGFTSRRSGWRRRGQAIERALALDPRLAEGWNEMGGVETLAGRLPEALRCYEKALALGPGSSLRVDQCGADPGEIRRCRRLPSDCIATCWPPIRGMAMPPTAWACCSPRQDRTDEARKLFELAISVRRDDSSAINNLAVLYMNTGRTSDAIAAFRYGIQVAPDEDILYLNLSRTLIRTGERDKARDVMRELLDRKPGSPLALRALKELEMQ